MSTQAITPIPLKLVLHRGNAVEIRRIRGDYNFSQIMTAVGEMWGTLPKDIAVAYEDSDGDRVRVGSQPEWDECLLLHREAHTTNALRLHVYRAGQKGSRNGSSSDSEDGEKQQPRNPQPTRSYCGANRSRHGSGLFHILRNVLHNAASGEVHVDVDLHLPRRIVLDTALDLMEQNQHDQARAVLSGALLVFPTDPIILYNLACAHALCGEPDESFKRLREAVDNGYDDATHILEDADLASLRGNGKFDEIVKTCMANGEKKKKDVPATESKKDAPQAPSRRQCGSQNNLRRSIIAQTNALMDQSEYSTARFILTEALTTLPGDSVILYNLACAHALCGEPDEALKRLREAVENGYDDPAHLIKDADLASLHGSPVFDEIVKLAESKKQQRKGGCRWFRCRN